MKENIKKSSMFLPATLLAAGFVFVLQAGLLFLSACDLGDSKKYVKLSGTVNVTFENKTVPHVEIGVDAPGQDWVGYKRLDLPSSGASWSIDLPSFKSPTKISFRVIGYDDKNIRIFNEYKEINPPVSVYNKNVSKITLDLGNISNNDPKNIIPLKEGKWCEGEITVGGTIEWYSFEVENGTKYYLWWNDKEAGDGTKMLDIDVYAFDAGVNPISLENNDSAWDAPVSFTSSFTGNVNIRVRALNWTKATGTYAIVYGTDSARPDNSVDNGAEANPVGAEANPIPLTSGVWTDGSLPSSESGRTIWYSFDVTKGVKYYIWWNDKDAANSTKTLDIKADAYYIEDGHSIFVEADSAWTTPMSFTSALTGKVKLKVTSFFKLDAGTFAIACGTSSKRP